MAKRPDIRDRIESYRTLCDRESPESVLLATRKALTDAHRLLVARAAELAGERLLYGAERDLIAAFARFREDPVKRDPGCTAKSAIARALVALDCQDADFWIAGIGYRQPEPVWGGSVDTAIDVRTSCGIGLAATAHPRALIYLVDLLHDPEPHVRAGAVRAIVCTPPLAAESVLRSKARSGDPESEVTGDCLAGLLEVAGEDALDFVDGFVDSPDPELGGLAALALGASHLDGALARLRARWDGEPFKRDAHRVLLRAAALHRAPAALDWLVEVAGNAERVSADFAIAELAVFRTNPRLRERLRQVLVERADPRLLSRFAQCFPD